MANKVIIHIEIEDCFQDCPFCQSLSNPACNPVCLKENREHISDSPITPPDWCPFRK